MTKLKAGFLNLFLLIVIGIAGGFFYMSQKDPALYKMIKTQLETIIWNKYENKTANFSIKYPPTWNANEEGKLQDGSYQKITVKGDGGYIDILVGSGFGGACPQGFEDFQIKNEILKACHYKESGQEIWAGFDKNIGNVNFTANAFAFQHEENSSETITKILSTLEFY